MPANQPPLGLPLTAQAPLPQALPQRSLADAEQRLRAVVDNIFDGIITIGEGGLVESFNPAAQRLFGYAAAEVIGRNVSVLMPEPYRSQHDGYLANYVRTGVAKIIGIGREVQGLRKDGSVFPMDLAVSEFYVEGRRGFAGIVRDVSERKKAEQTALENARLYAELKDADRRKDEFLAMLAHELRNPLAPIRSGLDLLGMEGVDAPTAAWARDMMKHQVQHLVRLVDDLLDVSRIMRGKVQIRKQRLLLTEAIDRGLETAQPLIASQGHEVVRQIPAEPIWIEADPVRISQVITNLLNNAAKYNNKPGHIWVTAQQDGAQAVLRIRDDGIGMEADLLPHVFDLFTQANRSIARSQGGLGIGLTLVRNLVEMHGGAVEARSEGLDKGSEFIVRLPAMASLPGEANASTSAAKRGQPGDTGRHRVLIVDDNVVAAKLLSQITSRWHHEVCLAYTGESALEMAKTYQPDVVLLDIGLPGINGYEVAEQLRLQPEFSRTLLVAVTGYGQEEDRRRSRAAGFNHHLVKPVSPETLYDVLAAGVAGG